MSLKTAASIEPAKWITDALQGFAVDVGSIVPQVFEAYARVFHPAGSTDRESVRWSEVAASTRRVFHGSAQWASIAFTTTVEDINDLQDPPDGAPWTSKPDEGSLDRTTIEGLVEVLHPHTASAERCWFAFWDGWGMPVPLEPVKKRPFLRRRSPGPSLPGEEALLDRWKAPKFSIPGRDLLLFSGSLGDATEDFYAPIDSPFFQSAYLWWPDDRAWLVATEIDFDSTYVGGTRACIDALVDDPSIEVLEVSIGQGVTWESDTINPNPLRL